MRIKFPIVDSHIHLYAESHIQDLAWAPSLPNDHVLKRQNSVEQYRDATRSQPNLLGFVFVETDRKSSLTQDGWVYAIEEIKFLRRIKEGTPVKGEGHTGCHKDFLLGIVAWAPLGAPLPSLQNYLGGSGALQDLKYNGMIKGFRYLLQDKPMGTALNPIFIDGLLLLEKYGAKSFDLGVDFRQGGHWQLVEAIEMLERFYARSTGSMNVVVNHFCKPNLHLTMQELESEHVDFENWRSCVERLSKFPTTYMKLSGFFSELPQQSIDSSTSVMRLLERTRPYVEEVFRHFGPSSESGSLRVMFGSDWPVCNAGGPGPEQSWSYWVDYVDIILQELNLKDESRAMVWAGCAKQVYGLDVSISIDD